MGRKSRATLAMEATIGMDPVAALVFRAIDAVKETAKRRGQMRDACHKYNKTDKMTAKNKRHRWKNKTVYKDTKAASDKAYFDENRERRLSEMKIYQKANRERINELHNAYLRDRRSKDPTFLVETRTRSRLGNFLRSTGKSKSSSTFSLVGCSPDELRVHLSIDTVDDMLKHQIDHIFPLVAFRSKNIDSASHYSNLQMLPQTANRDKFDKLPTKAMAAKVDRDKWPPGITEDMLPDIYPGWATALRM